MSRKYMIMVRCKVYRDFSRIKSVSDDVAIKIQIKLNVASLPLIYGRLHTEKSKCG